jgi:hypothetical protein
MHNCGTCKKKGKTCFPNKNAPEHWSIHPSDMHPCDDGGEAVVASAVAQPVFWVNCAGLVFADVGEHITAFRDQLGKWTEWLEVSKAGPNGILGERLPWLRFDDCGLLLPTAAQLPEMYRRWKEEHGNA